MEKLVLIDGNSLINRAFYALPPLSTKDGVYTNAVHGFLTMLFKVISDHKPSHVAVAFDLKAPTFRHKLFSDYKGTRKPMPFELRPQIPLLKDLLQDMHVAVLEKEGWEADDIIGTIAKRSSFQTLIFTGDRDALQLVDNSTSVHFTKRGTTDIEIYSIDNFTQKTGLSTPSQIIDLKSLMGDSSDNIPGVPGIGEKTAKTLLGEYSTVENVFDNLSNFKGKLLEKLQTGEQLAKLSKTLATIDTNCDLDINFDNYLLNLPFSSDVRARFYQLELKSLASRSNFYSNEQANVTPTIPLEFSSQDAVSSVKQVDDLAEISKLDFNQVVSLAILPDSINFYMPNQGVEYRIPINDGSLGLLGDGFSLSLALNTLTPLFTNCSKLIVYDKKELLHMLKNFTDCTISCPCEDVAIINYLTDYIGGAEKLQEAFAKFGLPLSTCAQSLYNLFASLYQKLIDQQLLELYKDVELPLADVLFDMEVTGFKVDEKALYLAGEKYKARLTTLENQIRLLSDEPTLNVNSPKQLGEVLFEKLKIGKGKKTKYGYSTSAEILEGLESSHDIVPLILEYRKIQKLLSTYIDGFKPLIEKPSGLIHTSFNQTVTSTGRLSSKEPNLQNIPVRDDEGRELRKFFVPRSQDRILVSADYSQIELRLLADFSNSPELIKAFNNEVDIHAITASKVFSTPLSEVSKLQRSRAKAVNFGIIYGMSEYGLAKQLNITPAEAKGYISAYFNEYPHVKQYMEDNVSKAKTLGYSKTVLGRRRMIREINSSNYNLRQFGERAAMNMPLQGSSADIIKLAMINVFNRLKKEGLQSKLILQVHDELIIDALISEQTKVEKILVEEMQNALKLSVPLTVSSGSGKTWFEAK